MYAIVILNYLGLGWLFETLVFPLSSAGYVVTFVVVAACLALAWPVTTGMGIVVLMLASTKPGAKAAAFLLRLHAGLGRTGRRFRLGIARFRKKPPAPVQGACAGNSGRKGGGLTRSAISARLTPMLETSGKLLAKMHPESPGSLLLEWAKTSAVAATADLLAPKKFAVYMANALESIVEALAKIPCTSNPCMPETSLREPQGQGARSALKIFMWTYAHPRGDRMTRYHARQAYEGYIASHNFRQREMAFDQLEDVWWILHGRMINKGDLVIEKERWDRDEWGERPLKSGRLLFRWRYS